MRIPSGKEKGIWGMPDSQRKWKESLRGLGQGAQWIRW